MRQQFIVYIVRILLLNHMETKAILGVKKIKKYTIYVAFACCLLVIFYLKFENNRYHRSLLEVPNNLYTISIDNENWVMDKGVYIVTNGFEAISFENIKFIGEVMLITRE